MKAKFVHQGESIDYIPSNSVSAGDVVPWGNRAGVASLDIEAGRLGAISIVGVYDIVKGNTAFSAGDAVYWDSTNQTATATATGISLGFAVEAASADAGTVRVRLDRIGTAASGSGITQQGQITSLTNNSGGVASNQISAPSTTYSSGEMANATATLAAKINEIITALRGAGVIASAQ